MMSGYLFWCMTLRNGKIGWGRRDRRQTQDQRCKNRESMVWLFRVLPPGLLISGVLYHPLGPNGRPNEEERRVRRTREKKSQRICHQGFETRGSCGFCRILD